MRKIIVAASLAAAAIGGAAWAQDRKPPYWASISSSEAMMRTGPGRNYPAIWLYRREDLPIRVIAVQPNWRKVRDPGGATGWMLVNLLSDRRTAIVSPGDPRPLRAKPAEAAAVSYRAAPGVVGRASKCAAGWCRFEVRGKSGYIRQGDLWGVTPGEVID